MVNNLVSRWPKPLFFMGLGAHLKCEVIFSASRIKDASLCRYESKLFHSPTQIPEIY